MAESTTTAVASHLRFAEAKFRPTILPATLVTRSVLHDRLTAGGGQRLTVVVGSAGAGKSVLLSSWAATRVPGVTSLLSCDSYDPAAPAGAAGPKADDQVTVGPRSVTVLRAASPR